MSCDFNRGDVIMVKSALARDFLCKRVFVKYIEGASNPYICVHEDDEGKYLKGESFRVEAWDNAQQVLTDFILEAKPPKYVGKSDKEIKMMENK